MQITTFLKLWFVDIFEITLLLKARTVIRPTTVFTMKQSSLRIKLILTSIFLALLCLTLLPLMQKNKIKWVMEEYYSSPRWNKLKLEYESAPVVNAAVLFYGNSMTENFKPFMRDKDYLNFGISGDFSKGLIDRSESVVRQQPKQLFIMIGINDLIEKIPVNEVFANYQTLIKKFLEKCPGTKIFIQSTLPTRGLNSTFSSSFDINNKVIELNERLDQLCHKQNITYVNLYSAFVDEKNLLKESLSSDGVHLTNEGYELWEAELQGVVQ